MEIRRPDPATGSGEAAYVHVHDRAVYGYGYVVAARRMTELAVPAGRAWERIA